MTTWTINILLVTYHQVIQTHSSEFTKYWKTAKFTWACISWLRMHIINEMKSVRQQREVERNSLNGWVLWLIVFHHISFLCFMWTNCFSVEPRRFSPGLGLFTPRRMFTDRILYQSSRVPLCFCFSILPPNVGVNCIFLQHVCHFFHIGLNRRTSCEYQTGHSCWCEWDLPLPISDT